MAKLLRLLEKENRNVSEETFRKALYMEEEFVKDLILKTMPKLNIEKVEKVNNNFLEGMYVLTREEYNARCGSYTEMLLLHVTSQSFVSSITKDNLDWRKVYRGGYGVGSYFSNDAHLANSICNPEVGTKRAIIVCKVLVSNKFLSNSRCLAPPSSDFDTGSAYNGRVYIKFRDNEFLPLFVAYYDY